MSEILLQMIIYLKLQNATSSLKLWLCNGVESCNFLSSKLHTTSVSMVMNLLAFWSRTVGTSDAVVSQRHSHTHLHNDILGCLHAGGDNWLEAAELGKREMPVKVRSVMAQPGREGDVTLLRLTGSGRQS